LCCVQRLDKLDKSGNLPLLKEVNVRKVLDGVLMWSFDVLALENYSKRQYVLVTTRAQLT